MGQKNKEEKITLEQGDEHLYLTEEELHIVHKYIKRLRVLGIMGAEDAQGMEEAEHIMLFSHRLAKARKELGHIVGIKKQEKCNER